MRSCAWLFAVIVGCSDEHTPETDAGTDADAPDGDAAADGAPDDAAIDATGDTGSDATGDECEPACGMGRECCGTECVNTANDPRNCGGCDTACDDDEICTGGDCLDRPCTTTCTDSALCCGGECCATGQICCDPQGPIDTGPRCLDPSSTGTCPQGCAPLCQCASPDTPIATPDGERAMGSLNVGDIVYSVDRGAVVEVPIVAIHRRSVVDHEVQRVTLSSGVVLEISAGHPTADGRTFADLAAGDMLDGTSITSVERTRYPFDQTYDILPASSSGTYYAGGVLIGSTLLPPSTR